jgi:integrase/recombinase XerC
VTPAQAVDAYLSELSDQRRLSPHTVVNYRRDLDKLLLAAGDTPLDQLLVHHIRRFVAQMHARGLSGRSLGRLLSAWRGFFAWLGERGLVRANPCEAIKAPKSPRLLPKALSVDETSRLLEPAEDEDPRLEARDAAMFELFYSSGLRLAELVGLERGALDGIVHEGEVRVLGKRNKLRLVPVGRQACEGLAGLGSATRRTGRRR